jgi:DNA-binding response OmpR family regulator
MGPSKASRGTLLLVEDDVALAASLREALEMDGYRVWHAGSGQEAREYMEQIRPDLIILDLILPDVDGLILCTTLKAMSDAPIVVCSGTGRRRDVILALKLGADDFLAKPFGLEDLEARIEAILRRSIPIRGSPPPERRDVRSGDLVVDMARRKAMLGGDVLPLTPTEFRLLSALASHPEAIVTREDLARLVWGYADASNGRTIDVHIRRLRVKLGSARVPPPTIVSVRGHGYKLERPTEA